MGLAEVLPFGIEGLGSPQALQWFYVLPLESNVSA